MMISKHVEHEGRIWRAVNNKVYISEPIKWERLAWGTCFTVYPKNDWLRCLGRYLRRRGYIKTGLFFMGTQHGLSWL